MKFPTRYWLAALLACSAAVAQAQLIVVEPDNYPNQTVLNHVVPEVSLITAANNNEPHPPVPFDITGVTSIFPFLPPSGTNVFGHANVPFFYTDRRLRMDFAGVVSFLSIDFQGGNALVSEIGRLEVYDAGGMLLDMYLTGSLLGGDMETMSITRPIADIAWAVAYTWPGSSTFGRLDHLVFNAPVPVPEPGVWALLLVAGGMGWWTQGRVRSRR